MSVATKMIFVFSIIFAGSFLLFASRLSAILKPAREAGAPSIIALAAIMALAVWLRFFNAPADFKVFYEEYEIYNLARMIDSGDMSICAAGTFSKCEKTQEWITPPGFSFLASVFMKATGNRSPAAMFALNALLGTATVFIVFVAALLFTGSSRASLFAALFAACQPLAIVLSHNGSAETCSLFFVSLFFLFIALHSTDDCPLSAIGALLSGAAAFASSTDLAFMPVFAALFLASRKPFKPWRLALAAAALSSLALIKPYYTLFEFLPVLSAGGLFPLLKANASHFINSDFYAPSFSIAALAGGLFLFKKAKHGSWATLFALLFITSASLYGRGFFNGDFIRYSLPMVFPMAFLSAIFLDWICDKFPAAPHRAAFAVVVVSFLTVSSAGKAHIPLNGYMSDQDAFLKKGLKRVPENCSIYSVNPSMSMAYSKNPSYDLFKMNSKNPEAADSECRVVVLDLFCASSMMKDCAKATSGYSRQVISKDVIYGSIPVSIEKLNRLSESQMPRDSKR